MEKEFRNQIIIGTLITVGIFVAVLGIINGIEFASTYFGRSDKLGDSEPDIIRPETSLQTEVSEKAQFRLPETDTVLYFPLTVNTDTTQTEVLFENNNEEKVSITLTLLNNRGDWHTYDPWAVEGKEFKVNIENLANIPPDMNPGIAIVAADHSIAAIANIKNSNGLANRPLPPYLEPARDIYFELTPAGASQTPQNTLLLTNLSDTIAEAKLSLSSQEATSENGIITDPIEVNPWQTQVVNLEEIAGSRLTLSTYDSILVSGSKSIYTAAICTLDSSRNTWTNISAGEPR